MSWLIKHAKAKGILARRQELPEEAFISVEELKALYGNGNEDSVLPIIAISFCWLTASHPDPEGKQLAIVAAMMEKEQADYAEFCGGFSEMGVFWDWLSIYQKDPNLFDVTQVPEAMPEAERSAFVEGLKTKRTFYGGEAYEKSRTAAEVDGFRYALHETMDLWYAHQGTTVYMLTTLPEGSTRKVGYADSGWTTYERCSAEQIKKFYLLEANWNLVVDLGVVDFGVSGHAPEAYQARSWPIGPDDFDTTIESKTFTNGADRQAVKDLYRKMSIGQLGGIKELDFDGMSSPSVEAARRLGSCLNLCSNLETLGLSNVGMSDEAGKVIFSTLTNGALAQCTTLWLHQNKIGKSGVSALAEAVGKGALAQCTHLYLQQNQIGDQGMIALSQAVGKGAFHKLRKLELSLNEIGNIGITALATALESGALPAIKEISLAERSIHIEDGPQPVGTQHPALEAACEARGITLP